ncbi:hypothetical protein A2856_04330 [Candidatus Uhrbacteria bacterium RIFCSPHIGHO2_01_FULL_63_20]|uniref:Glycerophosphoryl diester phosphodiesterase membrane domain-containing protein n=1 Tax=Candidatus Uhrbacteria bacterium RIFCSPHIGHO2_01_FULL_63_20 TaxID=1802385 RepID=A0A1F7TMQ5_9BACT|nr:MAG: hypothetical protein A2856_04330 [Candidatus Uhrbacteria bacterium RIFCSPHIGHO2_01_FULL_63_20]
MARKPTPIYRTLLRDAWRLAWGRRSLWVFGLFAGLVTTGGVIDVAFRGFKRIESASDLLQGVLSGSFAGYETFGAWMRQVQMLEPSRVTATVTVLVLVAVWLGVTAVLSQGALIRGLVCEHDRPWHHHLFEGKPYFWRLLTLALAGKAVNAVLLIASALPLVLLVTRGFAEDAVLYCLTFLVFFPLMVVASLTFTLAAIDAVRHDRGAAHALAHATGTFLDHWLPALEVGVAAFLVMAAMWIASGVTLILLSIPYAMLVALSLYAGSPFLFACASIVSAVCAAFLVFAFTGASVSFQHAVWLRFLERAQRHRSPLVAKLERLWRKW